MKLENQITKMKSDQKLYSNEIYGLRQKVSDMEFDFSAEKIKMDNNFQAQKSKMQNDFSSQHTLMENDFTSQKTKMELDFSALVKDCDRRLASANEEIK